MYYTCNNFLCGNSVGSETNAKADLILIVEFLHGEDLFLSPVIRRAFLYRRGHTNVREQDPIITSYYTSIMGGWFSGWDEQMKRGSTQSV